MRKIIFINNNWLYKEDFKSEYLAKDFDFKEFKSIDLPHTNKELPYNYFDEKDYQFISCYAKTLNIDYEYKGKRIYLDFEGVMLACDIYLNGTHLLNHKGGYTPFSVDITDYVNYEKENTLVIVVDSTERKDTPPYGNVVDYLTYGGIYREVSLRIVENTHINKIYSRAYNCLQDKKTLEVEVELEKYNSNKELEILIELLDKERVVALANKKINDNKERNKTLITINDIKGVELWDLDNPKLYNIKATLKDNKDIIDVYSDKFGFREAIFKPEGFYLNGNLIKLIGLNRHQSYPYVGYAMPERVQKKDADILKYELGLNIVRTSHYMQSRHFLDRCDEIGLLVFEEIPGWQYIGDKAWQDISLRDVEVMIKRDYNRPSIILWGVRINESLDNHDFYTKTNYIAKKLDTVRQTGGVRYIHKSDFLEDVYTLNDFVHDGGEKVLITQKEATGLERKVPYLVTESNGHMYPTKMIDNEAKLVEHANRHLRVVNRALGAEDISGSISWCAFDYNTHSCFGSGDKICYHGVMDMFRNSKYAAYSYSSQKDSKYGIVLEPLTLACRGERSGGGILPFTILTNCDYVKIYKNGEFIDDYYPDIENYPNLYHPPVNVYHMLPVNLDLPISEKDKSDIRNFVINKIKHGNLEDLTEKDNDFFKKIADRSGISVSMILGLIFRLAGGWGEEENMITIKGYINNEQVISKEIGELKSRNRLEVIPDDYKLSLNKTSYDATRVVIKLLDNMNNLLQFNNEFIEVQIEGPAKILGPSKFGIQGGITAFWIRTIGEVGKVKVKVKGMYFETETIIEVE